MSAIEYFLNSPEKFFEEYNSLSVKDRSHSNVKNLFIAIFFEAIRNGCTNVVQSFLENDICNIVDVKYLNSTPLSEAILRHRVDIVRLLFEYGAKVNTDVSLCFRNLIHLEEPVKDLEIVGLLAKQHCSEHIQNRFITEIYRNLSTASTLFSRFEPTYEDGLKRVKNCHNILLVLAQNGYNMYYEVGWGCPLIEYLNEFNKDYNRMLEEWNKKCFNIIDVNSIVRATKDRQSLFFQCVSFIKRHRDDYNKYISILHNDIRKYFV